MFTGIVQTQAQIVEVTDKAAFRQLVVRTQPEFLQQLQVGASIAINGCCLTVVSFTDEDVQFDVIDETLKLTNLGTLQVGSWVNFERSLKVGDEIGGHHVSGHIHACVTVERIEKTADNWALWLRFEPKWRPYVFAKGFIAVNGASLTIGQVVADTFSLHLIPETLRLTNLEAAVIGDKLNVEFDQQTITIVDTVERVVNAKLADKT